MSANFAHVLKLDQIGQGMRVDLAADEKECGDIARRLGLVSLDRLEAQAVLSREGEKVMDEASRAPALRPGGKGRARRPLYAQAFRVMRLLREDVPPES